MSDRICVMRSGSIEQIGTPRDLYYRPKSKFVASFFGASNIIEPCEIIDVRNDVTSVRTPVGTFAVAGTAPEGGSGLALAVRPEAFGIGNGNGKPVNQVELTVVSVSFIGSETITELTHRDTSLAFKMKARSDPAANPQAPGTVLTVGFDPAECALVSGDRG